MREVSMHLCGPKKNVPSSPRTWHNHCPTLITTRPPIPNSQTWSELQSCRDLVRLAAQCPSVRLWSLALSRLSPDTRFAQSSESHLAKGPPAHHPWTLNVDRHRSQGSGVVSSRHPFISKPREVYPFWTVISRDKNAALIYATRSVQFFTQPLIYTLDTLVIAPRLATSLQ